MGFEKMTVDIAREICANLQKTIDRLLAMEGGSRERSLAITKLQEGKMWLGEEGLNAKKDERIKS
ncbi:MAG: hypothetical protein HF967_08635 [Methanosarcinales archaeon]|nr:hypothetical protein [Methanosarcinales archaeon]